MQAKLALEDGTLFEGQAIGYHGEKTGEVVFNTSMTGYQEILTDPSYAGQMVTMTYPLIGNYGFNPEDIESARPRVEGFVVRERSRIDSNYRSRQQLEAYLTEHRIIGIEGVDTRALTKHIRTKGAMMGVLSTTDPDGERLVAKAKSAPRLVGRDLVREVTCARPYEWTEGLPDEFASLLTRSEQAPFRVIAFDYGIKLNILRCLVACGCQVTVVPATTPAEDVLREKPDGVFLSNGPGDPEPITYAQECTRQLLGRVPIFGICLGHQILGLALGGRTSKLKFGHRGANQPVKNLASDRVEITSQNHGFIVEPASLDPGEVQITHINLNDQTVEGLAHKKYLAFSVQYHPEASPGPHDALYLFEQFIGIMEQARRRGG